MAITRERKQELVESYVESLNSSQAVMLTNYRGVTVQQIQNLRRNLREQGVSVQVVKNTLLKLALQETGMPIPEMLLEGPTAIVYLGEDVAAGSKAFLDATKDLEAFAVKGAILEGQILDADAARKLRELPTRATVLAQLLGVIQAPASELLRVLEAPAGELYRTIHAPLREVSLTLQSYADKGAEAGA